MGGINEVLIFPLRKKERKKESRESDSWSCSALRHTLQTLACRTREGDTETPDFRPRWWGKKTKTYGLEQFSGATLSVAYFTPASACSRVRLAEGLQRRTMGHLPRLSFYITRLIPWNACAYICATVYNKKSTYSLTFNAYAELQPSLIRTHVQVLGT